MIAIERYLDVLAPFARTPYLRFLVEISLVRILHRRQEPVETLLDRHRTEIAHVADWLTASVANEAPWLRRTDERSRPRKLMKLGSLEQAVHEADKAMRIEADRSRARVQDHEITGIERILDLPDGYAIVGLTSAEALDRESALMGHCIGNGAYDELLATDRFYSLVDRRGRPHATMHVDADGAILEIKGRANTAILPRYAGMILPWINANGMTVEEETHLCRLVTDEGGTIHCIDDLPEGCVVQGDLSFPSGSVFPKLPKDVVVLGSIRAEGLEVELPVGLKVRGDLLLRRATIDELPEGIEIEGDLDVSGTAITRLPRTFRIGGTMRFEDSALAELPDDLVVRGILNLRNTPLSKLPRNLRVERFLVLAQSSVEEITEDVFVAGRIDLSHSAIRRLPANFHAREDLDLSFTEIQNLPEGLRIDGSLLMQSCRRIEELPDDLKIGGHADLSNTSLRRLPVDMRVGGALALNGTMIRELPADLGVGRTISLPDGFEGDTHGLEIAGRPSTRTP